MGDGAPTNQGFHKLDEIGNDANIGIIGFTTWKQKIQYQYITPSEYWTTGPGFQVQPLTGHWLGTCYLGDL